MNTRMHRREFLGRTAVATAGATLLAEAAALAVPPASPRPRRIVDTHVHFYDPARPAGVPWPPKEDAVLYRTVLPRHYQDLPKPQPVTGVVVVEASPWVEDNQWILDLAARDRLILGLVGNLPAGTAEFKGLLERFAANPVFRGIRLRPTPERHLWTEPGFLGDLKRLADRGLSLDLVGGLETLDAAVVFVEAIPGLRVVIDHLAGVRVDGQAPAADWLETMRKLARKPNVFVKVSGLVEGTGKRRGEVPQDAACYQPVLDAIWALFGEDRLVYGSNWPVCELFAGLATVEQIVLDYFGSKGARVADKVFARNAQKAYRFTERAKPAK
jgi:L-fuconolactonase